MDPRNYGQSQEAQPQMTSRQHTRFSWQQPLDDEVPPYQERQQQAPQHQPQQLATQQYQTQQHYQQYQQPQQQQQQYQHQHHQPQPQPLPQQHQQEPQQRVDTDASRHFSYAQTPAEMRAFVYTSSPSDPPMPHSMPISLPTSPVGYTPIDPRPQSMLDAQIPVVPPQSHAADMQHSHVQQQVQPLVSPVSPQHSSYPQTQQYSPVSPIPHPQPVHQSSQANTQQQSRHARQMSNLSPINTNVRVHTMPTIPPTPPSGTHQTSPLPQKAPMTPISANSMHKEQPRQVAVSPTNQASYAHEPYSPHGFVTGQTNNMHAVFSPDAAHGPNGLDFAAHQPGQISHPNMESESSHEWSNGLCACSPEPAICFTGLFCPCIVYGRTSYRLSQKSAKNDPTDMLGHSTTNGHCIVMGLSCGLWWLFPMLQRTRIRRAYKIKGSLGSDLLRGCCCCCCVVVQNEREVKGREEASRRWAGPASTDVYTRSGGMVYKPQQ